MLSLVQLDSFVAVVDRHSFRDAAAALDLAQPTVSQHIAKLEASLGVRLVVRVRGRAEPTPAGTTLLPFARTLLATAARAEAALRDPTLAIAACSNAGIYMLPPHISRFRERVGAAARVDFSIATNPEVAARLERREADVAVMEWWDGRAGFESTVWRREPMVAIAAPDHPIARRTAVTADDLFGHVLIGGEPGTGTGRLLDAVFGADVGKLTVGRSLGSTEAVKRAVRAGLGISLVLESAVADEARAGTLAALPFAGEALAKEIRLVWPADLAAGSLARSFVDEVIAAA